MKNIIDMLKEISLLYESKGESWKSRAYSKAIRTLKEYAGKMPTTMEEWCELPGIGKGIAEKIQEFQRTNKCKRLKDLRKDAPPKSVQEFCDIPGVGIKKSKIIYIKYKAKTLKSLYKLLKKNKIEEDWLVRGMKILKERGNMPRIPLYQALEILNEPIHQIKKIPFVLDAIPAGSIRRYLPTVKDLDVIICVKNKISIEKAVSFFCKKYKIESSGDKKCYIPVGNGRFLDLYFCHKKNLGTMVFYLTGSGEWNQWVRGLVKKKGWFLNQYFLKIKNKKYYFSNEKDLLIKIFGKYVPPVCREKAGDMGTDISFEDIKGDLHIHSNISDGINSPGEIVRACIKLGYSFCGFCEHVGFMPWSISSSKYNEYLESCHTKKGYNEIFSTKKPFRIWRGAEVDVSKSGKISIKKSLANKLDVIAIAAHQNPGQNLEKRYTKTMIKFSKLKGIRILTHPINRNMNKNVMMEWGEINWLHIFKVAKETKTYIEINGSPERMDLDPSLVRIAKSVGCKFVLSSDAHSTEQIYSGMYNALMIAKKAQLQKEDILNITYLKRKG